MLTIFRHTKECPHTSRKQRNCKCPISVEGYLRNEYVRRSLDVVSWDAAQRIVRDAEAMDASRS